MEGLVDKAAFVSGAGSGIGQGVALRLAAEGAIVAAVDRDGAAAEATVAEIEAAGGRAKPVVADLTDAAGVTDAVAEAVALGGLDILVNSISHAPRKSLADIEVEEWQATLEGSLTSYFLCIKSAVPAMIARGGGKIVSVCSITAHVGYGAPAYTAAKGGILAMTRELAGELAPHRININSVSPGVVETGINRDTLADRSIRERTISLTPWGRLGRPEDIAGPIAFLASSDADYITGADLVIDGAMSSTIAWGEVAERFRSFHSESADEEQR